MSATTSTLFIIATLISQSYAASISPTNDDGTDQYFVLSDSSLSTFQAGTITCTTTNCFVTCDDNGGCNGTKIDGSGADYLMVTCEDTDSCMNFEITKGPQIELYLKCSGRNSCEYSTIDVSNGTIMNVTISSTNSYATQYMTLNTDNMPSGSELNVVCNGGSYTCRYVDWYCPIDGTCDIKCITGNACYAGNIYIPDNEYEGLELDCGGQYGGCDDLFGPSIDCEDTGKSTRLEYADSEWDCEDLNCCPFPRENIYCLRGQKCEIDCGYTDSTDCYGGIVNGTTATELSVYCGETTCEGATIYCPIGDDTSCSIDCGYGTECKGMTVVTGNGNDMNKFELYCSSGSDNCQSINVDLTPATIQNVSIECESQTVCKWATFNIESDITDLYFECLADNSCNSVTINFNGDTIDTFNLDCNAAYYWEPCKNLQIDAGNTIVNDLIIDCSYCNGMGLSTQVVNSAIIKCTNDQACTNTDIYLNATSADTTFDITCGENTPDYSYDGPCYYAAITIRGYVDDTEGNTNSLSLSCDEYGCYYMDLFAYNMKSVDITCTDLWSCRYADFITETADSVNLNCGSGEKACGNTEIGCSGVGADSCEVTCGSSTDICNELEINVPNDYEYGYFDFSCGSSTACSDVTFTCVGNPKQAFYNYNADYADFRCDNDAAARCCPDEPATPSPTSDTAKPTTAEPTTASPTSSDGTITDEPTTANPTTATDDPTSDPTLEPTIVIASGTDTLTPTTGAPTSEVDDSSDVNSIFVRVYAGFGLLVFMLFFK